MWRLAFLLLWVVTQYIYSICCPGGTQKLKNGQRTCNTITTATTNFVAVVVVVVVMLHISTLAGRCYVCMYVCIILEFGYSTTPIRGSYKVAPHTASWS